MNDFKAGGMAVPALERFEWGPPGTFLGVPPDSVTFDDASVVVLPVPYEATVSYMPGTRHGPRGILNASRFIELYDHELDIEPHEQGVYTLPELMLDASGPERALEQLRDVYDELVKLDRFVIMLGGEHSLSSPPILSHAARAKGRLSVLQFDAHADLRCEYDGTPFSHACVMHRVHEEVDIVPVGIRSLTADEMALVRKKNIPMIFSHELEDPDLDERILSHLGEEVYITFDVDFFDPSVVPSTGTPEPGGGFWHPTLDLLERVFRERKVVGADVVELAPLPGLIAPDFMVAKLVHKLLGFHAVGK